MDNVTFYNNIKSHLGEDGEFGSKSLAKAKEYTK